MLPRSLTFRITWGALSLLPLLFLASCLPNSSSMEAVRTLQAENERLNERTRVLQAQVETKEMQVQSTTRLVHKILDDLAALAVRKDLIRGLGLNPPAQLASDFPENERAVEAAERLFHRHLSLIESNLRDSQDQIDRVRNAGRIEPRQLAALEANVAALKGDLVEAEVQAEGLRATLDSLTQTLAGRDATIEALRQENEVLRREAGTLERAYLAVGTGDELEARGIVDQRFLRPTRIVSLSPERFSETSITAATITLTDGTGRAKVLSIHNESPQLYTIEDGVLRVHDPSAFWARSKFLVVEVED